MENTESPTQRNFLPRLKKEVEMCTHDSKILRASFFKMLQHCRAKLCGCCTLCKCEWSKIGTRRVPQGCGAATFLQTAWHED